MKSLATRIALLTTVLLIGTLVPGVAKESGTAARGKTPTTAAAWKYSWGPTRFDFGWEYGEPLSAGSQNGSRKGSWVDTSTGSGRVSTYNGGMKLQSALLVQYRGAMPGDQGTVAAAMRGLPRKDGRWEVRMRPRTYETAGADYRIRIDMIPARAAQRCRGSITVADFAPRSNRVRVGLSSPRRGRSWARTHRVTTHLAANAFAVEVAKGHITWFINGRPVGNLRKRAFFPKVPLTMRISMVGVKGKEMSRTMTHVDWVRSHTIKPGKKVRKGPRLKARRIPRSGC